MPSDRSISFEIRLTVCTLVFTLAATALFLRDIAGAAAASTLFHWLELLVYAVIIAFLIYGNVGYQLTRIGHLQRRASHRPDEREALEACHDRPAEPLVFLVPSYREEARIVRQTLLSAALQEHPNRRVVLLIDDPFRFDDPDALAALVAVRTLATSLDHQMAQAAAPFLAAREAFLRRAAAGRLDPTEEAAIVGTLYLQAAEVLESEAALWECLDHTDRFFVDSVLRAPALAHRKRGKAWLRRAHDAAAPLDRAALRHEHARLASLFAVSLTSFERKRFANLSHEPNKAMNLNTYIALLGKRFDVEAHADGVHLVETKHAKATLEVPPATYLITLDADSLLLPDYALRLVAVMEAPGNERIAVAQTPYSAVPDASGVVERTAGATTDIQYLIHQGFTQHHATFWVGANALLRHAALNDIAVVADENGRTVRRYIQDRTVIEDTESTVDLIDKGWRLYNYPERLAYSATPADFGALVVQRARWANGGLIILPKLLRYLLSGPRRMQKLREGFFRVHYLTSIAGVNLGLLAVLAYPFPDSLQSAWLPLTALPYYALYARDLRLSGYERGADLVRVYVLNLLLLPINVGGVLRSLHQAAKGHRIPFLRTPKIAGRTGVPARYVAALFAIVAVCLFAGLQDLLDGNVVHSTFALANGLLFLWGIGTFIGFGAAWHDLHHGIADALRALRSAPIREGVSVYGGASVFE
jgi:cellulose synthase/poly-beta-1,6-N-acetylglucosamine synthase-like glycosyltransferase